MKLTFEHWLDYVFDHPTDEEPGQEWCWQKDGAGNSLAWWRPEPIEIAEYLERLLTAPWGLMDRYNEWQIDAGLTFIFGVGSSQIYWNNETDTREDPDWLDASYTKRALHPFVPADMQERWIRAIFVLYRDLYARHCVDWFGLARDQDRPGDPEFVDPLHNSCFMLWDLDELYEIAMLPRFSHLVEPIFDVLQKTLQLNSAICRAAALHALGHLHKGFPERTASLIDAFLDDTESLHPNLRTYACDARAGRVL